MEDPLCVLCGLVAETTDHIFGVVGLLRKSGVCVEER
jgi:hypothetical protein